MLTLALFTHSKHRMPESKFNLLTQATTKRAKYEFIYRCVEKFRFLACTRLMLRSSMERRCFSLLNIIYGFFSFHYIFSIYGAERVSLLVLNQIRREGSRSASGSCKIIKIFMAFLGLFSGVENHFKVLLCSKNYSKIVDDKRKT